MNAKILTLLATGLVVAAASQLRPQREHGEVPVKYRDTVRRGLEWLAKNQLPDGGWDGEKGRHPTATTALAGMALLLDADKDGKHVVNLRKAVDWLLEKAGADRDGLITAGHASETDDYMEGHGLATQMLAWALRRESDETRRKKIYEAVSRAVRYTAKSQSSQGGWHRTSKVEGHDFASIQPTAVEVQALQIASESGMPIEGGIILDGQQYLKARSEELAARADEKFDPVRFADFAASVAGRITPYSFDRDAETRKQLARCRSDVPMGREIKAGRDEMSHYYVAQVLFNEHINANNATSQNWEEYRTSLYDHLQSVQAKDGSWPASAEGAGSVRSTAVWCLVLQVETRRHPLVLERALETL